MSDKHHSANVLSIDTSVSVGKTALIRRLSDNAGKYLFTRPPGFGKTWLVKSLAAHFKHAAAASLKNADDPLVVCLDLSTCRHFQAIEAFRTQFQRHISDAFSTGGFTFNPVLRFSFYAQLSRWLQNVPTASLVLLVDNYDAPIRTSLNQPELLLQVTQELATFFTTVKSLDRAFRFVFLTSILPDLSGEIDDVIDLSRDPLFSTLIGFTEEEISTNFRPALQTVASRLGLSVSDLLTELCRHYGHYCFDDNTSIRLLRPASVLRFLQQPQPEFQHSEIVPPEDQPMLSTCIPHLLRSSDEPVISSVRPLTRIDAATFSDAELLTHFGLFSIFRRNEGLLRVRCPNLEAETALVSLSSPSP